MGKVVIEHMDICPRTALNTNRLFGLLASRLTTCFLYIVCARIRNWRIRGQFTAKPTAHTDHRNDVMTNGAIRLAVPTQFGCRRKTVSEFWSSCDVRLVSFSGKRFLNLNRTVGNGYHGNNFPAKCRFRKRKSFSILTRAKRCVFWQRDKIT